MKIPVPDHPKIYHIVHVDRIASIAAAGCLWSDAQMIRRQGTSTTIGISKIKNRRLTSPLACYPDLHVGDCVPFYFCPRSVMLYLIYRQNRDLAYKGGQDPIVHLEADLHATIDWAKQNNQRWVFTLSNAGASYFDVRSDIANLDEINWNAVRARKWSGNRVDPLLKEGKQAEFLIEGAFPWRLVERIGIHPQCIMPLLSNGLQGSVHRPVIEIKKNWYY